MHRFKTKELIIIYSVICCILLPGVITVFDPSVSGDSRIELRNLQDMPKTPHSIKELYGWPRRFEQYVSDRFPYREKIIRTVSKVLYQLGISISSDVLVGREGWLFLKKTSNILNESRGIQKLSDLQLKQWVQTYTKRKEKLEANGTQLFLVFIPNKHTVYPRYLPDWFVKSGETITDQIVTELQNKNIDNIIDLRPALSQIARQEKLYNKFNSHWNDIGAYYAYSMIISRLPGAHPVHRGQLTFKTERRAGDLSRLIGNTELTEAVKQIHIINSNVVEKVDWKTRKNYLKKAWSSKTRLQDGTRALFLCDSFTNSYLYKYLVESFKESIFKHHQSLRFDENEIDRHRPDLVVYIIAERLIPYSFN